jgi:GntR family transcriptional regulator
MSLPVRTKPDEKFKIDRLEKLPLYELIERNLRDLILSNQLQPGDTVPPEWELAELYGVSRLTVRRALDDLVRQDWLNRRQGVGTFVSRPAVTAISPSQLSFTQEMLAIGRRPTSRLLERRLVPSNAYVAQRLSLNEGDVLVELTRLRLADNMPILLETVYLSSQRFPGLEDDPDLENGSLYDCLSAHYGVIVARVDNSLKAVLLDEEQASLLNLQPGVPSICSECVAYSPDGEPVEYSRSVAHNENSQFYFVFRRGES